MDDIKPFEKIRCDICQQEQLVLIKVETAADIPWGICKGICFDCLEKGKVDEQYILKTKSLILGNLKHSQERLKYWEDQANRLEGIK